MRRPSDRALTALRVVQSHLVSSFSRSRRGPAQVQFDEAGDGGHLVVGVAQRLHPIACHARPDHLVVVERHDPAGRKRTRPRLADVVEERGQAQHPIWRGPIDDRQSVGQDVLVPVDRVLFEGECGEFG
jgi:hypothetical protein